MTGGLTGEELRQAVERLSLWHTIDEMAVLLGIGAEALKGRIRRLGCPVYWRRNHHGGLARMWTDKERYELLTHAERYGPRITGRKMNRAGGSVSWQIRQVGGWRRGTVVPGAVAKLAGCSEVWALRKAKVLWPMPGPWYGSGKGRRYRLELEDAELLMKAIRPGRVDWVSRLFEAKEEK